MFSRLKAGLRASLLALAPQAATAIFSARARAFAQRSYSRQGCLELNRKLLARVGPHVLAGPFAGLELSPMTQVEHLGPYLAGTYESELHPTWDRIFQSHFEQILDIGAKFGYYATGLGRQFPSAEVIAFDPDPWARRATREMAEVNRTPNVKTAGFCSVAWLRKNLAPGAFLLSDCEGYEGVLFGEASIPAFRSAMIIVELHDHARPGVEQTIVNAFFRTHKITRVPTVATRSLPPELMDLSPEEKTLVQAEFRTADQSWLFLEPLSS